MVATILEALRVAVGVMCMVAVADCVTVAVGDEVFFKVALLPLQLLAVIFLVVRNVFSLLDSDE